MKKKSLNVQLTMTKREERAGDLLSLGDLLGRGHEYDRVAPSSAWLAGAIGDCRSLSGDYQYRTMRFPVGSQHQDEPADFPIPHKIRS